MVVAVYNGRLFVSLGDMGKQAKQTTQKSSRKPSPLVERGSETIESPHDRRRSWMVSKRELLAFCWIAAIVLICYANTLDNDFIHDDKAEILSNQYVKDLAHIPEILSSPAWVLGNTKGPRGGSNYYRPFQYLSYAALYKIFGPAAWGFHLAKLAGHMAVCLLFLWIVIIQWGDYWLGLLSASLYALHPVNTEAVSWISGITDVSCAFFFLLCWHFFLKYNARTSAADLAGLHVSFFVGLFCKEFMVTLVPLLLLYQVLKGHRISLSYCLKVYGPMSVAFVIYVVLRIRAIGGFTLASQFNFGTLTFFQSVLNQLVLLADYIRTFFFPVWLNAFHTFHPVLKIGDFRVVLALSIIGAFLVLSWFLFRRLTNPRRVLFVLASVWFILTLSPVLILFKRIGENVFAERYFYLPALGMCLVAAIGLLWLHERFPLAARALISAVILFGLTRTVLRNQVWQDDLVFYEATVKASPGQAPLLTNLGYAYLERGRQQEALQTLEQAVALRPDIWQTYENLGRAYHELGRLDESVAAYRRAAALDPYRSSMYSDLASVLAAKGEFSEAIAAYQKALEVEPQWEVYFNQARLLAAVKRFVEAQAAYENAAKLNPNEAKIFAAWGDLLFAQNRQSEAISYYRRAVELNSSDLRTWYNLADSCLFSKKYGEAIAAYKTALSLDTKSPSRARHGIETAKLLQGRAVN